MPKKHTYEYVKNYIESFEGYKLLSEEYKDARAKLRIKCSKGHIFWMSFYCFKTGNRCPECAKKKRATSKRLTYENVKNHIEMCGYKLLSKKYIKSKEKIKLQCPKGHIFWMSFNNFKTGNRCVECYGTKKLTFYYVKNYIEDQGYKLLSEEYKNSHTNLKLQCPNNHIFWMSFSNFQQGYRCAECCGNKKYSLSYIKEYVESRDYELLSEEYINSNTKIELLCPHEHIFWMSFHCFKSGQRCPSCYGNRKLTNQEIIKSLQKYENIRENKNEEIEVTCKYCGDWFIPKRSNLTYRILYINGKTDSEYNFYCSQKCKDSCPIYNQILYPKGYKPATSREVQPQLRQLVFERDNYTCQKCGWYKDDLDVGIHCHHKYPLNENPVESADVDACITLCEDCHKWIHMNVPGCGYGEMRCNE